MEIKIERTPPKRCSNVTASVWAPDLTHCPPYVERHMRDKTHVAYSENARIFSAWQDYNGARFGEIRVNAKGDAVLTGLRDAEGERLGPALQ